MNLKKEVTKLKKQAIKYCKYNMIPLNNENIYQQMLKATYRYQGLEKLFLQEEIKKFQ